MVVAAEVEELRTWASAVVVVEAQTVWILALVVVVVVVPQVKTLIADVL